MPRSLNRSQLIGNLGRDPEHRSFQNGGSVVTFPVATTETWKDRNTGERREKTEWHRVAIFSEGVGRVAMDYLKKGSKVFIEGKMETRKWTDQSGAERYTTEVVVRPYSGDLILIDSPDGQRSSGNGGYEDQGGHAGAGGYAGGSYGGSQGPQSGRDPSGFGSGPGYGGRPQGGSGSWIDDEVPF